MNDFVEASKKLHATEFECHYWPGAFDDNVEDTKRHYKLLDEGYCLIEHIKPQSVLTIGDSLARDAGYFKKKFPDARCIASDLSTNNLSSAVDDKWVDEVTDIDVEAIPFPNASFDVVVAKEAFHHWPRPMLGLYEMLRVAKKAILLIEPNDVRLPASTQDFKHNTFPYFDHYEKVGNYKYCISVREIIKVAWALYYPMCAYKGFNDPYKTPFVFDDWIKEKTRLDLMGSRGEREYNLYSVAIFKDNDSMISGKQDPSIATVQRPLNPHFLNDCL